MSEATTPAYSVVIEWENLRLADAGRARPMLRALYAQVEAQSRAGREGEILVVTDSDPALDAALDAALAAAGPPPVAAVRRVAAPATRYYQKKNAGAGAARGAVVVFLDSDVIPEDGWLAALLEPFADPTVDGVGGTTYVEPRSAYDRAFAAFWFFPLRDAADTTDELIEVYANNLAFRRAAFLARPFPEQAEFRGAAGALVAAIRAGGGRVLRRTAARCVHPAPNGFLHLLRRGACEGHDQFVRRQRELGGTTPPWRWSRNVVLRWLDGRARERIRERAATLGLDHGQRALAHGVATVHSVAALAGHLLTRLDRRLVPRFLSI
ncbi:MAG: glycosyltransferase [Steroidobacteraceae bacterium]|jgi:hypothetical protein|nr:glycosyltransferase [Steroidobacteraceae bacterium]